MQFLLSAAKLFCKGRVKIDLIRGVYGYYYNDGIAQVINKQATSHMLGKKGRVVDMQGHKRSAKEEVLENLYQEHGTALRCFLRARLGLKEDTDDLAQEVFIRLAQMDDLDKRLPKGDKSSRSFIFKVANNLARDLERHKLVRSKYIHGELEKLAEDHEVSDANPERAALVDQQLQSMKAVIMQLRPKWREAFLLNRMMQMTYSEIAIQMGVSAKQVEKYMKHALIHIRHAIQQVKEAGRE